MWFVAAFVLLLTVSCSSLTITVRPIWEKTTEDNKNKVKTFLSEFNHCKPGEVQVEYEKEVMNIRANCSGSGRIRTHQIPLVFNPEQMPESCIGNVRTAFMNENNLIVEAECHLGPVFRAARDNGPRSKTGTLCINGPCEASSKEDQQKTLIDKYHWIGPVGGLAVIASIMLVAAVLVRMDVHKRPEQQVIASLPKESSAESCTESTGFVSSESRTQHV